MSRPKKIRPIVISPALIAGLTLLLLAALLIPRDSTKGLSRSDYRWLAESDILSPLGIVRVTKYTYREGGRGTSSGYILSKRDIERVCAASRDLWGQAIMPRDRVFIEGFPEPCEVLDTMADANEKGFKQRKWIDVYSEDKSKALDFGIQKRRAWLVRRK